VKEINAAQAKFAKRACFANIHDSSLDGIVQNHISSIRLATNAFTAWHRLAEDGFFDFMMSIV
jgi:hypothetical protein